MLVEFRGEVWNAAKWVVPPSVIAELIALMAGGEISRRQAKEIRRKLEDSWVSLLRDNGLIVTRRRR